MGLEVRRGRGPEEKDTTLWTPPSFQTPEGVLPSGKGPPLSRLGLHSHRSLSCSHQTPPGLDAGLRPPQDAQRFTQALVFSPPLDLITG